MKFMIFFTLVSSLLKAGLIISLGVLIKNHFETMISYIVRKPIPNELINNTKFEKTKFVINWIGLFIILIGIGIIITSLGMVIANLFNPDFNLTFNF